MRGPPGKAHDVSSCTADPFTLQHAVGFLRHRSGRLTVLQQVADPDHQDASCETGPPRQRVQFVHRCPQRVPASGDRDQATGDDVSAGDLVLDAVPGDHPLVQHLANRMMLQATAEPTDLSWLARNLGSVGEALLGRITPTADLADLAGCDMVIEAVFEDPALKHRVFAETEPVLAGDALLASNTSTLPITLLAQGVSRPKDFIGLHFFSPVDKMPLVEIIVGEATGDEALAKAFDVVQLIRKTPIVVNDSRGFFTSRVIGRFMDEAVGMLAEGVHPQTIEQAALQVGYPTGPLALTDEVSLTLTQHIRASFATAAAAEGKSFPVEASHAVVDRMVDEFGRPGRAGRAGFYEYTPEGKRLGLWPGLVEHFAPGDPAQPSHGIPFADLGERMLFVEAIDSVNCLDEGVLRSVGEGNVGSILGIGFPPWTGGVLQYIEGYPGGVAGFVACLLYTSDAADE